MTSADFRHDLTNSFPSHSDFRGTLQNRSFFVVNVFSVSVTT